MKQNNHQDFTHQDWAPSNQWIFALLLPLCGCVSDHSNMNISEALQQHSSSIMDIDGVTGVGEGELEGEPCVTVFVVESSDPLKQQIRNLLPKGIPLSIRESGQFESFPQ